MQRGTQGRLFGFRQLPVVAFAFGGALAVLAARALYLVATGAPNSRSVLGLASDATLAIIFAIGAASKQVEPTERVFAGLVVLAAAAGAVLNAGMKGGASTALARALEGSATLAIAVVLLAAGLGSTRRRS